MTKPRWPLGIDGKLVIEEEPAWAPRVPREFMLKQMVCPWGRLRDPSRNVLVALCARAAGNPAPKQRPKDYLQAVIVERQLRLFLPEVDEIVFFQAVDDEESTAAQKVQLMIDRMLGPAPPCASRPARADRPTVACSFCGLAADKVRRMIEGAANHHICDSCHLRLLSSSHAASQHCDFCSAGYSAAWVVEENGVRICSGCLDLMSQIIMEKPDGPGDRG